MPRKLWNKIPNFWWKPWLLILFLLASYLKRSLTLLLITFWRQWKSRRFIKVEFKKLLSLATRESYFISMESSTSKSMESLMVHRWVWHWLMLFLYTLKRICHKIVHLTLSLITNVGMFMISLFYSFYQNI